ncbi:MAG: PHP domain-containing protein [Clostridia bacterium]|nr:PHP domain-containing protein [Clostridia bacterium]
MIDLHMHTKYSDGTNTCTEILKKAEEKQLTYISITDHNTCKAYEELKNLNIKELYKGRIIKGVELNTKVLGIPIEILGYGVDTDCINQNIDKLYISNQERNIIEVKRIYEICLKNNIDVGEDFIENYNPQMYASKYLHQIITKSEKNKFLIDEDSWNNSNIFYRKFMSNPDTLFFVNTDDIVPTFEEASKLVKDAGGLVFIPHIFEYRDNAEKILKYILENYVIDGIECFYTTFTEKQKEDLIKICKDRKLFMSGGSDYHGDFKPDVDMATGFGNLKIEENIINDWKNDVNTI